MRRVETALIALAAVLLPVALLLSHRNVPVILALIGLAGVMHLKKFRPTPWMLAAIALIGWASVTTLWSGYADAMSWIGYLLVLGVLTGAAMFAGDKGNAHLFIYGVIASLILLTVEALSGGILRDIIPPEGRPDKDDVATARGITTLLCLMPALALWIIQQTDKCGRWLFAMGLASLICANSFGITANLLSWIAALIAGCVIYLMPRWGGRLVIFGAVLPFLMMPIVAALLPPIDILADMEAGPASWRLRLIAWEAVWQGMIDSPLTFVFGHGVEGTRVLGEAVGVVTIPGEEAELLAVPTHPHNVYIQIWYDLGLIGVGLSVVAIWLGWRAMERAKMPKPVMAAIGALIAISTVLSLFDASLWTLWRVAGPLLGAWLIILSSRDQRKVQ